MCRTPEIVSNMPIGEHTTYRCVNCDRSAHKCLACGGIRCDSDIHFSIMGQIPFACVVCQPNGIDTWMGPGEEPDTASLGWVPKGQPRPWEKS